MSANTGHMKDPHEVATPPVVGAICVVLVDDPEVPLRAAYWCSGVWRDPHTARAVVPEVRLYCQMGEALAALCGAGGKLDAELDGLANRGVVSREAAERAKRWIAERE